MRSFSYACLLDFSFAQIKYPLQRVQHLLHVRRERQLLMTSLPDDLTQPVIIQKTDPNGAQLSGAELSVVDSNGVVQTNIVTTYNTTTLNLSKGEYFLHESGAPDGYQKAQDIWFSVNPTVDSRNGKRHFDRQCSVYWTDRKRRRAAGYGIWERLFTASIRK
ncbi:MAG: SpaA isopeptide-forming pilin-related protein [Catenisphaera adipataccumulans]|uniref:SpaA isopeptide-forming pilin-related protein n=1 Tax=Catenisphaera adipataccumulans TaxID=700500 RepID=UPI003D933840